VSTNKQTNKQTNQNSIGQSPSSAVDVPLSLKKNSPMMHT